LASRPRLLVPQAYFEIEIRERIAIGKDLSSRSVGSESDLDSLRDDFRTWDEYNKELLRSRFTASAISDGYAPGTVVMFALTSLDARVKRERRVISERTRSLESLLTRLDFYVEGPPDDLDPPGIPATTAVSANPGIPSAHRIFIVHGRNETAKLQVARFLETATEATVTILHEQAGAGRTILEKFEHYASASTYAVVLLTADDKGGLKGSPMQTRARQNVVFEFGFFVGALTRNRVAVLYELGVELPSDLAGIGWIEFDRKGAWQIALTKELREAGIIVSL
jgi:hypothetical protein